MSDASAPPSLPNLETKIVIIGDTGVGKTSMLNQFLRGQFIGNMTATIGAAFMRKTLTVNNCNVVLQIWDTAGQERFRSMAPMYYRGADAAVLVYDVTIPETLEKVQSWVDELHQHATEDIIITVAGNKTDLKSATESAAVARAAENYCKSIDAHHFETSAKTGKGINECFRTVATLIVKQHMDRAQKRQAAAAQNSANSSANGNNGNGSNSNSKQRETETINLTQKETRAAGCCY